MVALNLFILAAAAVANVAAHPIHQVRGYNLRHRRIPAPIALAPATHVRHRRALKCKPPVDSAASSAPVLVGPTEAVTVAPTKTQEASSTSKPSPTEPSEEDDEDKDEDEDKDDEDEPEPTKTPSSGSGKLSALFPVPYDENDSWSTNRGAKNVFALADNTLNAVSKLKGLDNSDYVNFAGKKAIKAHYPAGSFNPSHSPRGGLSYYAPGPDSVDLTQAKEATFGYSVYCPSGFKFNLGGKLPGFYGGDNDKTSLSCSGGRRSDECFSARLMWREQGDGELYTYLPPYTDSRFSANKKQCTAAPNSDCNPTYGASIGRGTYKFATGAWTTVAERVRLNDVGKANGEIELFVNGKSEILVKGLIIRARSAGRIRGLQMQTFFGGSNREWATPKDQDVYFADLSVAITEKL